MRDTGKCNIMDAFEPKSGFSKTLLSDKMPDPNGSKGQENVNINNHNNVKGNALQLPHGPTTAIDYSDLEIASKRGPASGYFLRGWRGR